LERIYMAVLIEAISIVIRHETLEAKYPGGVRGYFNDCPNKTFCADEHLSRIGFMASPDIGAFARYLEQFGFVSPASGIATDFVVVDQMTGPTTPCEWVQAGRYPEGFTAAWLMGTQPGKIYAPDWWSLDTAKQICHVPNEKFEEQLLPIRHEDGLTTYLDLTTGKETEVGRLGKRWH
jgi:hypothetical protein